MHLPLGSRMAVLSPRVGRDPPGGSSVLSSPRFHRKVPREDRRISGEPASRTTSASLTANETLDKPDWGRAHLWKEPARRFACTSEWTKLSFCGRKARHPSYLDPQSVQIHSAGGGPTS